MITIISGTNRKGSLSKKVSLIYEDILKGKGVETQVIDLAALPQDFVFTALYENAGKHPGLEPYREAMVENKKFVFVVPEYNGSFPGVLKAFIDGMPYPSTFVDKKCALVGLSSGVQGAGPALSHLTDIFNYCGMHVLAQKPRLANINKYLQEEKITNELYMELLETQAQQLIDF